ncbi:FxLD family lantipeptide [Streptomyces zhaozhouensis]|jgi:FxLD family lantipeptide|uniref:FxLD family lantipeptide n=1 Tax=Streptomyces zhaozhouensis TaxID=1300267 RepID=A0A286EAC2_9ACTN|nr:FxLD family lanthipeptide [Streptomyces zhaozhouensis]SOD67784.1 FxLD family lantipeptide [Streptomyces zhaozhouensis]
MSDPGSSGSATVLAEPSAEEFDDFTLDVRVVVATRPHGNTNDCPTDDGCGDTCQDGASACDSFIDDPA